MRFVLRHRAVTLIAALLLMASTVPVFLRLGSEFMPPLYEGTFLYMPITLPGASVQTAQQILAAQDKIIKQVPGGRVGLRQGGPGPLGHRSGARSR